MKRFALTLLLPLTLACTRQETRQAAIGNPEKGKQLISQHGCNVCHTVPGIAGARGSLGPSLDGIATRPAISYATVQNTPENLARFLQNPRSLNPQSTMPPINLTTAEAQDIAAYLFTLK